MTRNKDRQQKFKREGGAYTKDAIAEARAYWQAIAKEGGWASLDELVSQYVMPMAANRQAALDRYEKSHGKKGGVHKKRGAIKAKPKAATKAKARKRAAKPPADVNGVSSDAAPVE